MTTTLIGEWVIAEYPAEMKSLSDLDKFRPRKLEHTYNVITITGLQEIAKFFAGLSASRPTHHGIGTGTNQESEADTALQNQVARKAIQQKTTIGTQSRMRTVFTVGDIPGNSAQISEAGIFPSQSATAPLARMTSESPFVLNSSSNIVTTSYYTWRNRA